MGDLDPVERCPVCDRRKRTARDSEQFAAECPNGVPEPGAGQLHLWQGVQKWYDALCWATAGPLCHMLAVNWRARALAAESARDGVLQIVEERSLMAQHHAVESAEARGELERYQQATEEVRETFLKHQEALTKAKAAAARERHLAVRDEREACAKAAEAWADSQDRIALEKEPDAPASAQSHMESAFIGRRIAGVIRALPDRLLRG